MAFVVPLVKREYEICFSPPKHPVGQQKLPSFGTEKSILRKTNSNPVELALKRGRSIDYGHTKVALNTGADHFFLQFSR